MLSASYVSIFAAAALLGTFSLPPTEELSSSPATVAVEPIIFFDNDCRIDGPNPTCEAQAVTYTSAFAGTNYSWTLPAANTPNNTAGAFFCGPTNQQSVCITTTQTGFFRLQMDYHLQSGNKSCAIEVTVNPALTIIDLAPQSVCPEGDATFVTSVLAGNGPFTYAWTVDHGAGAQPIPGANTAVLALSGVSAADEGQYCVSVGGQCGTVQSCASLTLKPALTIAELSPQSLCAGGDATFATGVLSGNGPFTYSWTVDHGAGAQPIPGANTDTLALHSVTLADAGQYCVSVTGECGTEQSCGALIVENCGGDEFCTLTQGAYGNSNGKFNGISRLALINQLLATNLVVGKPGRSLTIQAGNGACVISRLPAVSSPASLPAIGNAVLGAGTCQTSPLALPLQNGKFKNVLLGQTITLALNTRLDPDLSGLEVCETMVTQLMNNGLDGLHGTSDDAPDAGPDGIFGTADDVLTVHISVNVINGLATLGLPLTVGGVLELANRALAGQATGGASVSEVNCAVDSINRGFDECRKLLDCH